MGLFELLLLALYYPAAPIMYLLKKLDVYINGPIRGNPNPALFWLLAGVISLCIDVAVAILCYFYGWPVLVVYSGYLVVNVLLAK